MPESPLEKLLRLAGGTTKSYVRTNPLGRRVAVHQYPTPHPAHGRVAVGSLKAGQVVQIKGVNYTVVRVNVPPFKPKQPGPNTKGTTTGKNTGSKGKGKGVNTSKTAKSGASAGQGVNTAVGPDFAQNPQTAALAGVTVPKGAATTVTELRCIATKAIYFATLPKALMLAVVG